MERELYLKFQYLQLCLFVNAYLQSIIQALFCFTLKCNEQNNTFCLGWSKLLQTSGFCSEQYVCVQSKDIRSLTHFRGDERLRAGTGTSGTEVVSGNVSNRATWHSFEECVISSCTGQLGHQHRAHMNNGELNDT